MSKSQSNNVIVPAAKLLPDSDRIDEIATQTGLVIRKSAKFDPFAFLMVCVRASISSSGTLEELASALAKTTSDAMSRSAMCQRFHEATTAFFVSVLYETLGNRIGVDAKLEKQVRFGRILVEGSTQYKMNAKNSEAFPGHGNGKVDTAGCKVDFTYDLISREVVDVSLHHATEQDKEIGKQSIRHVRAGDLFLRDMGYFIISEFDEIERRRASWASRLPANVNAYVEDGGKKVRPEDYLRDKKGKSHDVVAYVGESERKKVRLVAMKVDAKTLAKRRRERNKRDAKAKKKSSADMKTRDGWHLMTTNIGSEETSAEELAFLYRLRWQIELSFKAWKQSGTVETALSRKSNEDYLQCMVLASMIRCIMSFGVYALLQGVKLLSMDKVMKRFSGWIKGLTVFAHVDEMPPLEEDDRHIKRDLRKRQSLDDIMDDICAAGLA